MALKKQLASKKVSLVTNEEYLKQQKKRLELEVQVAKNILADKEAMLEEINLNLNIVTGKSVEEVDYE